MRSKPETSPSRQSPAAPCGGARDSAERSKLAASIVAEVARNFRVREAAILSPARTGAREALARHVAMYLAHVVFGWTYAEIAARFGRHRTCVSYACARIEDRRDEARFDERIARIERRVETAPRGRP